MISPVTPIKFFVENIGKIVKTSKKSYNWLLQINSANCHVLFTYSKFSGNFKLFVNKKFIYSGNNSNENTFGFKFVLQKVEMNIKKF